MAVTDRRHAIAERVRAALADQSVTQQSLAEATGIPERTLARRLSGRSVWTLEELDAVAEALAVPVGSLVA